MTLGEPVTILLGGAPEPAPKPTTTTTKRGGKRK